MSRRTLLQAAALGMGSLAIRSTNLYSAEEKAGATGKPTAFQIACMTLPYSQFPLARALTGIQGTGHKFVAWGTTHKEEGDSKGVSVMPAEAQPSKAKELGQKCRDLGLEPLMMFSGIYPEDPKAMEVFKSRILQAEAAGMPQVLTFGHTKGPNRKLWVERFKQLGPIARDHGVLLVVKQHGETGEVTGEIVREVDDKSVQVNYDAGNVMDYTMGKVNPLEDIKTCAANIRSFCIKDHRMFPVNQDCGPGLGEIDHYRLLHNIAFTGLAIPLCCENISVPAVKATTAEEIDANARRSREFLELVIRGLHAM
ncbi:MAG: sugar phosphate isomerase/epimerase [Planctomycetales bacterium]|nr:sugar phosphate isomerase/epimerase [Planctomycetales bacterium]